MNKKDYAIQILNDNYTMFNSCLTKEELKKFHGDFVAYLIKRIEQDMKKR